MRRSALLITIVALASLGLAVPVSAAAPSGDLYANRTVISTIPYSDSIDTTEATTDADDLEALSWCGPVPTDASVWFEYTPTTSAGFDVLANTSDYSVGIVIATGAPGSFELVGCGAGEAYGPGLPGVTFAILVFDFQEDGGGNGGTLNISVGELPPAPVLDMTIASSGHFNAKTGVATIHGTVSCTGGDTYGKNFAYIQLSQAIGRIRLNGEGYADFPCDGTATTWSADVYSSSGKFAGGKATVHLSGGAYGSGGGANVELDATVTLKK